MSDIEKYNQLHASNRGRVVALGKKGLSIDEASLNALDTKIKLEAIYESVTTPERRTADKLKFETVVSKQLDSIDQQVAEMESQQRMGTLLQGVPGINGRQH